MSEVFSTFALNAPMVMLTEDGPFTEVRLVESGHAAADIVCATSELDLARRADGKPYLRAGEAVVYIAESQATELALHLGIEFA